MFSKLSLFKYYFLKRGYELCSKFKKKDPWHMSSFGKVNFGKAQQRLHNDIMWLYAHILQPNIPLCEILWLQDKQGTCY